MQATRLRDRLSADPFEPFYVRTTRTGVYEIKAPGLVLLTTTALYIGNNVDDDGLPQTVTQVPLAQIVQIEPAG
jgi:hypothetical protein